MCNLCGIFVWVNSQGVEESRLKQRLFSLCDMKLIFELFNFQPIPLFYLRPNSLKSEDINNNGRRILINFTNCLPVSPSSQAIWVWTFHQICQEEEEKNQFRHNNPTVCWSSLTRAKHHFKIKACHITTYGKVLSRDFTTQQSALTLLAKGRTAAWPQR